MADGGVVKKKRKPMKPPEKGGTPKRIATPGKPGDSGPGGAKPARNRKKMADGGAIKKKKGYPKKTKKPKASMLGTGMAANAGKALSGRAAKLAKAEKDAGL